MYPDNWVLVSCLLVITCLVGLCILTFKLHAQLYDKPFSLCLTLFACLCVCVWFFSFCDDHQFIDMSRCENSSKSLEWWRFRCVACLGLDPLISEFSFRNIVHVLLFEHLFWILLNYYSVLLMTSWCVSIFCFKYFG